MLDVKYVKGASFYKWDNCIDGFNMPLKIYDQKGKSYIIHPTNKFRRAPKGFRILR